MIETMRFLTITGPKNDFDRAVNTYLSKYDFHLENALTELDKAYRLKPFAESNPYKELLSKSEELIKRLDNKNRAAPTALSPEQASEIIDSTYKVFSEMNDRKNKIKTRHRELNELLNQLEHFRPLDYDISQIRNLKFIQYRFGKIPREFYTGFTKYVYDNMITLFFECEKDRGYVWGIYFVPASDAANTDAIFTSLHFEGIRIPDSYQGTPEETYQSIAAKIIGLDGELHSIYSEIKQRLNQTSEELLAAHDTLERLSANFDVRKLAACTREQGSTGVFYIICGWMTGKDAQAFLTDVEGDDLVYSMAEDSAADNLTRPPTKLKNFTLFQPFELFIRMYGLPSYNEIDPTSFVAITYSLIFGIMFGDVGQGICLIVGGYALYHVKHYPIAAIISLSGIFSTIFGFMYGSIFGFDHVITPVWMSPRENVMTILYSAVGFGVFLILVSMLLNIINGIKARDWGRVLFDTNGAAGFIFYAALILSVVMFANQHTLPGVFLVIICFLLPLLLIFFREPLSHALNKKERIFPEHKGMFFMETSFELFEILLSYLTNTISFLRIGAFALSHAGMMAVVMLLAGASSGHPNVLVLVLGNLIVAVMEGLVVGIQVLRLEYYEMFGRFYKGAGREFKPYRSK